MGLANMDKPTWPTNRSFWRLSLQSLFLLTALVGVSLAYYLSLENNKKARIRNYVLEQQNRIQEQPFAKESGKLHVIDPTMGYVRRLGSTGGRVWRYRVYLPPDKPYHLRMAQEWVRDGFPVGQVALRSRWQWSEEPGEFIVTLAFEVRGGRSGYQIRTDWNRKRGPLEHDCAWAWNDEYDHAEQQEFDPDKACHLFKDRDDRPGRDSGSPSGFTLWLSPNNAEAPTRFSNATAAYREIGKPRAVTADDRIAAELKGLRGWTSVDNAGVLTGASLADATDSTLERLAPLKGIESLSIHNAQVHDAGLEHLQGLTSLKSLSLDGTRISDDGLIRLEGLIQLRILGLARTKITGPGLVSLQNMLQLQSLDLSATGVTDASLQHLSGLARLRFLDLRNTSIDGSGLAHLQGLSLLRLDLSNTLIDDKALIHLRDMDLLWLELDGTRVTGEGLSLLSEMTGLRSIKSGQVRYC